jgi:hypothetical protein
MKCAAWMRRSVNPHPLTTAPHRPKLKADAPFDEGCWTDSQPRKEAAMRRCWTVALLVVVVASSACAMAYAQSGRASYVGRWAENPEGCRNQPDAVFTTRGMEGNENSCRFDRIRGGSGRWHIAMTCHGEGTTVREKVELFVNVNTIQIKYLDRGNASQKLVRCP